MGWVEDNKGQGPWAFSKGEWPTMEDPWKADSPNRPTYNEGNLISTYADPTWSMKEFSGDPITDTHDPCGYWTKNYVPNDYLIGWYKFDEGSGLIVNNYATNGSLGGGLLPDLDVVDTKGDFWSFENGFGSTSNTSQDQVASFAWKELDPLRFYGGNTKGYACSGIFFKLKFGATFSAPDICNMHNQQTALPSMLMHLGLWRNIPAYRVDFSWAGSYSITPDNIIIPDGWHFVFIPNDRIVRVVLPNGTIQQGLQVCTMNSQLSIKYLYAGCRYHTGSIVSYGICGSYGDWIIYNFNMLTISEWAQRYDELRGRYGMAARSGW